MTRIGRALAIFLGKLTSALDANSQKIENLAEPTASGDAATKNYVDTHATGTRDYNDLSNKPSIGSVTLSGSKSLADIGAAAASHTHTKSQITDFPTSMTPTAHSASHATGGTDPITPSAIGAEPAGTASSAVAAHDASAAAHSTLFAAKADATALAAETARATDAEESKQIALVAGPGIELYNIKHFAWSTNHPTIPICWTYSVPLSPDVLGMPVKAYASGSNDEVGTVGCRVGGGYEFIPTVNPGSYTANRIYNNYNISVTYSVQASLAKADSAVQSFSEVGGVTPAVASGVADLSTLFTSANTSLVSTTRYALAASDASSGSTLADRTINRVTMTDSLQTFSMPNRDADKARDFIVRVEVGDLSTIGGIAFSGVTAWEGDALTFEKNKNYLVAITETKYASNAPTWLIKVLALDPQTQG